MSYDEDRALVWNDLGHLDANDAFARIESTIQSLTEERDALRETVKDARAAAQTIESARVEWAVRCAELQSTVDTLREVEKAARIFTAQPGVRLSEPFESAWLNLVDALAALSTTEDREPE